MAHNSSSASRSAPTSAAQEQAATDECARLIAERVPYLAAGHEARWCEALLRSVMDILGTACPDTAARAALLETLTREVAQSAQPMEVLERLTIQVRVAHRLGQVAALHDVIRALGSTTQR